MLFRSVAVHLEDVHVMGETVEQRAGRRERHVAEFIDDEQLVAGELALQTPRTLVVAGLRAAGEVVVTVASGR